MIEPVPVLVRFEKGRMGKVQKLFLIGDRATVVAPTFGESRFEILLVTGDKAVPDKKLRTYEERIAREGGDAAVRRIPIDRGRGAEGQDLPVTLPGLLRKSATCRPRGLDRRCRKAKAVT